MLSSSKSVPHIPKPSRNRRVETQQKATTKTPLHPKPKPRILDPNTLQPYNPTTLQPYNPTTLKNPVNPLNPINPVNPINLINPINPINPKPYKPFKPYKPYKPSKILTHAGGARWGRRPLHDHPPGAEGRAGAQEGEAARKGGEDIETHGEAICRV